MVFQCFSWIVHFLKQIKQRHDGDGDGDDPDFCKQVTSSSNRSSERPLLLRYYGLDYPRFSTINGNSENRYNYVRGLGNNRYRFVSCCNKLILLEDAPNPNRRYIINSLSMWSSVIAVINEPGWGVNSGHICGFFFHPKAREYMILCTWPLLEKNYDYQLYQCGAQIWRRVANSTSGYGPEGKFGNYIDSNPAIVNGCLHWFLGKIMVFDILTEEFCLKPSPFEECYQSRKSYTINYVRNPYVQDLLVKDGCLCFCCARRGKFEIEIWILEDYNQWFWNKKYVVSLSGIYKFSFDRPIKYYTPLVSVISIHEDELVLFWVHRGLFSCHLDFNIIRKIPIKKIAMDNYSNYEYLRRFGFVAYT